MRHSERLERIPPYLFAQLERKIAEKRAAGIDVITLGIGDPDVPTFPPIVEAAQRAVANPSTHTGHELLRAALRRHAGPRPRGDAGDRCEGVHLQPQHRLP
jgi:aspartate/methionine/tyrosine aminotransferase